MKSTILMLGLLCACSIPLSHAKNINQNSPEAQKVGYSFGYLMGRSSADSVKDLDIEAFIEGLRSAVAKKPSAFNDEEMAKILSNYKKLAEIKEFEKITAVAQKNAQIEANFLAENAKHANIKVTASGLQYQVLQQGKGTHPTEQSIVRVHYEGRLIDGTIFDSSIARDEPVDFPLQQVIQGWIEGLQLMNEGAKYRFFIPAALGYGEMGSGDSIEPNSTLIFEIELLKILPEK